LKKIVIIGPESTGKSVLCEQLAAHYKTIWCKEYAREYLLAHGTEYTFNDLLTIAKGQLQLEEEAVIKLQEGNAGGILFIDTDMYVMKVWCEYVFGKCHTFILQEIAKRNYDGYLLCDIDLPWVKDALREYPDLAIREKLFYHYKDLLVQSGAPWALVHGTGEDRLACAIRAVEAIK
jgi:NadR type nicotinamide-nucleotide adenylyltransferase